MYLYVCVKKLWHQFVVDIDQNKVLVNMHVSIEVTKSFYLSCFWFVIICCWHCNMNIINNVKPWTASTRLISRWPKTHILPSHMMSSYITIISVPFSVLSETFDLVDHLSRSGELWLCLSSSHSEQSLVHHIHIQVSQVHFLAHWWFLILLTSSRFVTDQHISED